MNKQITLTNETINELKKLYNEIDIESNKNCNDCNIDIITENQFKILDTIKELIFNTETKIPTVTLEIPLYEYDDDDNMVPLEGERLEETISEITSVSEVRGFAVGNYKVTR